LGTGLIHQLALQIKETSMQEKLSATDLIKLSPFAFLFSVSLLSTFYGVVGNNLGNRMIDFLLQFFPSLDTPAPQAPKPAAHKALAARK